MQTRIPEDASIRSNTVEAASEFFSRGQELLSRRQVNEAIECFDAAQRLEYVARECAASRWYCWMLLGNFERAWQESDFIASTECKDLHRYWSGNSWDGQRVMLRCLHGLGDSIQFIRYAALLRQSCRSLAVQTHPELVTLLECVPGVDRVCTWGQDYIENASDWDMQMEVTELPRAFRTTLATIPDRVPYIELPKHRIKWGESCLQPSEHLRVGVVWQSSSFDTTRSLSFPELALLLSDRHCFFYSLQKDGQPKNVQREMPFFDLQSHLGDVRDTAALMINLDLVVTVDTMAAHLAGALGLRVWILLPARADWRWMLECADTPWYPTARIFRQRVPGDWSEVLREVRTALAAEARL